MKKMYALLVIFGVGLAISLDALPHREITITNERDNDVAFAFGKEEATNYNIMGKIKRSTKRIGERTIPAHGKVRRIRIPEGENVLGLFANAATFDDYFKNESVGCYIVSMYPFTVTKYYNIKQVPHEKFRVDNSGGSPEVKL